MTLLPGQMFAGGRYSIGAALGQSDVAELHEGRGAADGRPCLLEVLRAPAAANEAVFAECVREAGRVPSGGVFAGLLESGTDPEHGRFLVREGVPPTSLAVALAAGPLPLERVLEFVDALAKDFDTAHAAGVVHGGLLPSNVFLGGPAAPVKVAELGLLRLRAADPRPWPGAVGWAAPEQARGEALTGAADVYALALLVHLLLTGRHCFKSVSPGVAPDPQVVWAEMMAGPQPTTGLGPVVDGALARALAPQVADRITTCGALAQGLRATVTPSAGSAPAPARRAFGGTMVIGADAPPIDFAALAAARVAEPPAAAPAVAPAAAPAAPQQLGAGPGPAGGPLAPAAAPGAAQFAGAPGGPVGGPPAPALGAPASPPGFGGAAPAPTFQAPDAFGGGAVAGVSTPPKKRSSLGLIIGVVAVLMLLGFVGVAVAGGLYLRARAAAGAAAEASARAQAAQAQARASAEAAQPPAVAPPATSTPAASASAAAPTTALITFECEPACDKIECDGDAVEDLDAGVPLAAGERKCKLSRAGYTTREETVTVVAGKDAEVKVELEKDAAAPPAASVKPTATVRPTGTARPATTAKPSGKCGTFINPCKK